MVEQSFFSTKNEAVHRAVSKTSAVALLVRVKKILLSVLTPLCLHSAVFSMFAVELVTLYIVVQKWAWCLGGAKIVSLGSVGSCSFVAFCVRLRCC